MPKALIVDDDANSLSALATLVSREGFITSTATDMREARRALQVEPPDVLLADLQLPDGSGLDLLNERPPSVDVVLITGHATVDTAVAALRMGAADYLTKPVDVPRLKAVLANVTSARALRGQVAELRAELRQLGRFGSMIGAAPAMQRIYDLVGKVAPSDATVLVTGESGTGKELVAETIHRLSRRSSKPFVAINCGAISPTLIESELFGHERGSFTGADRTHRGCFERADGGTLLLDEVSEMSADLQSKLLRVLETGTVLRVGGDKPIKVDVRVIAASNRDLDQAVGEGKLRQDLLYRLKVFPILLPPLRERGDDVVALAQFFLDRLNQQDETDKHFSADAVGAMRAYTWHGNVRELRNAIHRAHILADGEEIHRRDLPEEVAAAGGPWVPEDEPAAAAAPTNGGGSSLAGRIPAATPLHEIEKQAILATLAHFGGDRGQTAAALQISVKTLYNRLREYKQTA
jgi:DNA-binding NtrC family response regulator